MVREKVPKLLPISEEMKQWSAMLGGEIVGWPEVSAKPMFGMTAYYRGEKIFACLPKTRSFETPRSVGFRLETVTPELEKIFQADRRIVRNPIGARWISFEIDGPSDLNAALQWLERAYEDAGVVAKAKAKRPSAKATKKAKHS